MNNPKIIIVTNIFDSVLQASPVVQFTLFILISLSIVCWGVAFSKYRQIRNIEYANKLFLNQFWKTTHLENLFENISQFKLSNVARVFLDSYVELKKLSENPHFEKEENSSLPSQLTGIDNLERVIRRSIESEINFLERRLNILATTGSTGPFIGLFGTVWGIMGSFQKIGATGSASLAVVAPGLSEALITTAIGLAAAIPAVILYNQFIVQIRRQEIELNNFGADFLNILKRNFFKGV